MVEEGDVTVRMFGQLHSLRRDAGLPTTVVTQVPSEGISAADLAERLGLPLDAIEGVFCNHTVYGLDRLLVPGDRVGYVPYGTPGPHRFFLGLYKAGKSGTGP